MKKIILLLFIVFSVTSAFGACAPLSKTYTACKPGYYLENGQCKRCPDVNGVYGTTVDRNTGDINSCYLPNGTTGSNTYGSYDIVGSCYIYPQQ